jgi:hypothetical protein
MAIERQTIDVRVEQLADSKASTKATKQLEANVNWINSEKQRLKLAQDDLKLSNERLSFDQVQEKLRRDRLIWLQTFAWTFFNTWTTSIIVVVVIYSVGYLNGVSAPDSVNCRGAATLCHHAREWGLALSRAMPFGGRQYQHSKSGGASKVNNPRH